MGTMTTFITKRLGPNDAALLKKLNDMFAQAFEDPESYARKPPSDAYLTRLLRDDSFIAIVAMSEHTVIGGLAAYELKKFEQERSELYLYDLAVLEAHRRQHVATRLIDTLKEVGKSCGAYVIFVQADKPDADALAFYRKLTSHQEDVFHFDIAVA